MREPGDETPVKIFCGHTLKTLGRHEKRPLSNLCSDVYKSTHEVRAIADDMKRDHKKLMKTELKEVSLA